MGPSEWTVWEVAVVDDEAEATEWYAVDPQDNLVPLVMTLP